jgi:hypothetical protein
MGRRSLSILLALNGCDCGGNGGLNRVESALGVDPPSIDFGELAEGEVGLRMVRFENLGSSSIEISLETDAPFSLGTTPRQLSVGESVEVDVRFMGAAPGFHRGRISVTHDAQEGPAEVRLDADVLELEEEEQCEVIVEPEELIFDGFTAGEVEVVNEGEVDCIIERISIEGEGFEIGATVPTTIEGDDYETLEVSHLGDPEAAAVLRIWISGAIHEVELSAVEEEEEMMLPEEVGRFLYYWRVGADESSDIMKLPLQGGAAQPYWGMSTGRQGCPGCHQLSPDGRYLAIVEFTEDALESYVVDTMSNTRIALPAPANAGLGFSWRPDSSSAPAYRYAFATGGVIHTGALFDGYLGELPGADEPGLGHAMPTWSSDGRIAFVRGELDEDELGFYGPTDIMTVPEDGGAAVMIEGASQNGRASYYPAFSPNALWIAYTESQFGETQSAPDARVRLVKTDGSGEVQTLDLLNGADGATSFPTWSLDGTHLSVSSNRTGGSGDWDIYIAPIDQVTGEDQAAIEMSGANTTGFEHAAQWSR